MKNSPWIVRRTPRESASLRLFCFPYAGGGSVVFHDWHSAFPEHIEVCAIEPPGRLARRAERACSEVAEFTSAVSAALDPFLDRPFAFFGYSLGALLAFECARALRRERKLEPTDLIVAASKAPQLPRRQPPISGAPSANFVRELEARYGPIEPVIKADPEMLAAIVDIMRVDLGMLERYVYQADQSFSCPILAVGGTEDHSVMQGELEGWRAQSNAPSRTHYLPGGHFFIRGSGAQLRGLVRDQLSRAALDSAVSPA
jgi:surfactin synthase thioesterase subunit